MARVLITRISSFGDVAMLVPVVYSVAAVYPQDRFIVLTRKAYAPLFENLGFNVSVKSFDVKRHSSALGFLNLLQSIIRGKFTHVADMHDVLRTKVIRNTLRFYGKKVAFIDKGRTEKSDMISNKTLSQPLKSTIVRYQEVLNQLGFPAEMSYTHLFEFREHSLYPLRPFVTEKTGNWIGIAPFSKHEGKIYPLEKMEKVLSMLTENPDNRMFLFGSGESEKSVIMHWEKKYKNTKCVSGNLNMEREMLLMSFLDVMISMDSANMHLASLVEVPVVSVWGATHPYLGFYGFRQDPENAVQIDLCCRPCSVYGDLPCVREDYACMHRIQESDIVNKAEKIISDKRREEEEQKLREQSEINPE